MSGSFLSGAEAENQAFAQAGERGPSIEPEAADGHNGENSDDPANSNNQAEFDGARPYDPVNGEPSRPGVSARFLRQNQISHVEEAEAEQRLGYQKSPGIIIPYVGLHTQKLMVNGRQFCRLRLDHPRSGGKYLSPKNSGSQLYIPSGGPPFGKVLAITEGEFKALALCEAGIRAVGVGGITSAMPKGELLPDLVKILRKFKPHTIYFLGDADTCLIFDFSLQAVKLAKALPQGCTLKLPRIPLTMPNGVDDCKEKLGDGFLRFWQEITEIAIEADRRLPASALAIKLVTRELPGIANLEDKEVLIQRILKLASYLIRLTWNSWHSQQKRPSIYQSLPFEKVQSRSAKNGRRKPPRKPGKTTSPKKDVARTLNDPRPKIEIPASRSRLLSEFGAELGPILAKHGFFAKDRIVVSPDTEKSALTTITGRAFRTKIEKYIIPFRVIKSRSGETCELNRTIAKEEAETLLESDQLIDPLPVIRAVNNASLPVERVSGHIELLSEGYDVESMIFTNPGGPAVEDAGLTDSVRFLRELFSEFCFKEDDQERALSVAIAAMLTLFVSNIIPKGALRPGFLYTANAEGSGKTLLARLAIVPRLGSTPTGSLPEQEEEIQKLVFSTAIAGSPILFFDNIKRHTASGAIEGSMTAPFITGRILGRSQILIVENMMTLFFTGNGATISPDLRRRVLHVELFLREARSEDRRIKHALNEQTIKELRPAILSALWSITQAWDRAGRPMPKLRMNGYEPWSEVVCGILEHAGFASPCSPAPSTSSGDRDTQEMEKLVEAMPHQKELRFRDVVELCREHCLFLRLIGEDDEDFDKGKKNIFSRILTKFENRFFASGATFRVQRPSKNVAVFYVERPT